MKYTYTSVKWIQYCENDVESGIILLKFLYQKIEWKCILLKYTGRKHTNINSNHCLNNTMFIEKFDGNFQTTNFKWNICFVYILF